MKKLLLLGSLSILPPCLLSCQTSAPRAASQPPPLARAQDRGASEAFGRDYAISTQGPHATQAARDVLEKGGNLVDAAIAASFVISVERPQSTGLAGGGFWLYHEARTGRDYAIDFRERAPSAASQDMFLKTDRTPDPERSRNGALAVAVPGTVAGLCEIHARFGKLPLQELLQPAIDLAEKGFSVYPHLFEALKSRARVLRQDPVARRLFFDMQGEPWPLGHVLIQKDLGQTLRRIATRGRKGFYEGKTARALTDLMRARGGILRPADLHDYRVRWREPVRGRYRDLDIVSMPPPSSGGAHVIQFLQILAKDDLKGQGPGSAEALHLAAAALQEAFADRALYLGDPDFTAIPLKELLSEKYARARRAEIPAARARSAAEVRAGTAAQLESDETTHLSLIDREGNAISTTQTINGYMGAAIMVPGTGLLLNNEMDDFSAQAGAANMFGAVGGAANAVAPGKTPLSSMSPTFVLEKGRVRLALGAPGGTRIISCVAQTLLNRLEFRLPLYESIASPRFHHQWRPDVLELEPPGPDRPVVERLTRMGYDVKIQKIPCQVLAVESLGEELHAVSDPRDIGTSAAR